MSGRRPFKVVFEDYAHRRRVHSYETRETREQALADLAARDRGFFRATLIQPSAEDGGKQVEGKVT